MSALISRNVLVAERPCRVLEKGSGKTLYWFPSSQMSLKWSGFHDALAARARVIACCLPGFGGSEGQDAIDDHLAWCLAARDLLVSAGFEPGDTLIGSSAAGSIAADVAALWPDLIGQLILISPFGLYDMNEPTRDIFALQGKEAPNAFCENPQVYSDQLQAPADHDPIVWSIAVNRANEAAARILWPFGDTRLACRLHRIKAPTLLIWGGADKIIPPSYGRKFADGMRTQVSAKVIAGAGHIVELDRPEEVADVILEFVN